MNTHLENSGLRKQPEILATFLPLQSWRVSLLFEDHFLPPEAILLGPSSKASSSDRQGEEDTQKAIVLGKSLPRGAALLSLLAPLQKGAMRNVRLLNLFLRCFFC